MLASRDGGRARRVLPHNWDYCPCAEGHQHVTNLTLLSIALRATPDEIAEFLDAHGAQLPERSLRPDEVQRVRLLYADWTRRPEAAPAQLVAMAFDVRFDDFADVARACGLPWINEPRRIVTRNEAHVIHSLLFESGLTTVEHFHWPPPPDRRALADLGAPQDAPLAAPRAAPLAAPQAAPGLQESADHAASPQPADGGDPRASSDSNGWRLDLHAAVVAHAREELVVPSKRLSNFLLRLLERISGDERSMASIRRHGLSLPLLQQALAEVPRVPRAQKGRPFEADVRWAVVRLNRGSIASFWLEHGETGVSTLVVRPARPPRASAPRRREVSGADDFHTGEIRWMKMHEIRNGRRSEIHHPAVIVGRSSANKWTVVSLTTDMEGSPPGRRVPRHAEQGLEYGGFVWHELQRVYVSEIGGHIGWVHMELVEVIDRCLNLRASVRSALMQSARAHHPDGT